MTKNLLAAELARILPHAEYVEMPFTLSLIALIVLFPVLLILTVIGAIAMRGNPFFTQLRTPE